MILKPLKENTVFGDYAEPSKRHKASFFIIVFAYLLNYAAQSILENHENIYVKCNMLMPIMPRDLLNK